MLKTSLKLLAITTTLIISSQLAEAKCNSNMRQGCWNNAQNLRGKMPNFDAFEAHAKWKRFNKHKMVKQHPGVDALKNRVKNDRASLR